MGKIPGDMLALPLAILCIRPGLILQPRKAHLFEGIGGLQPHSLLPMPSSGIPPAAGVAESMNSHRQCGCWWGPQFQDPPPFLELHNPAIAETCRGCPFGLNEGLWGNSCSFTHSCPVQRPYEIARSSKDCPVQWRVQMGQKNRKPSLWSFKSGSAGFFFRSL